jgi:hypothetical protein
MRLCQKRVFVGLRRNEDLVFTWVATHPLITVGFFPPPLDFFNDSRPFNGSKRECESNLLRRASPKEHLQVNGHPNRTRPRPNRACHRPNRHERAGRRTPPPRHRWQLPRGPPRTPTSTPDLAASLPRLWWAQAATARTTCPSSAGSLDPHLTKLQNKMRRKCFWCCVCSYSFSESMKLGSWRRFVELPSQLLWYTSLT